MNDHFAMRKVLPYLLVSFGPMAIWVLVHKAYLFEPTVELGRTEVDELGALGIRAIASLDVPVAALVVYRGEIIGRGYNTVLRDGNAGGHAELNAITDAMQHLGVQGFDALDRDDLVLITTFEPCAMCHGAILEYRIKRVGFIEPKSLRHHAGQLLRSMGYEARKLRLAPANLQDSLFRLHPAYDPTKDRH